MITNPNEVFQFLRGAMRGSFGVEDLRGRRILIIGMDVYGQQLLTMLCVDGAKLFFLSDSLVNYSRAHNVCPAVRPYTSQKIEVIVNLTEGFIQIKDKSFAVSLIGEDPYNQGIHEFYL